MKFVATFALLFVTTSASATTTWNPAYCVFQARQMSQLEYEIPNLAKEIASIKQDDRLNKEDTGLTRLLRKELEVLEQVYAAKEEQLEMLKTAIPEMCPRAT